MYCVHVSTVSCLYCVMSLLRTLNWCSSSSYPRKRGDEVGQEPATSRPHAEAERISMGKLLVRAVKKFIDNLNDMTNNLLPF